MTKENSEQDEKLNRLGISYEFNLKSKDKVNIIVRMKLYHIQ